MKNKKISRMLISLLKNPFKIVSYFGLKGYFKWIPDSIYLKILYASAFNKKLNLKDPQTYNEKIQWLKLNDRNSEYIIYADKYAVKKYIREEIGDEFVINTLGVWNNTDEIKWDELPNQFVLKTTHDSGGFVICKDKSKLDIEDAKRKIEGSLTNNYYYSGREWPYKNIKPRIIAEEFKQTKDGNNISDYRFFCFNGEPKFVSVDSNFTNKSEITRNLYNLKWELLDAQITYPRNITKLDSKPINFDKMINIAKKLSKNIPHIRIDLYNIEGEIFFGEMTFYHQGGFGIITPEEFNYKMGSWIDLPVEK